MGFRGSGVQISASRPLNRLESGRCSPAETLGFLRCGSNAPFMRPPAEIDGFRARLSTTHSIWATVRATRISRRFNEIRVGFFDRAKTEALSFKEGR